MSLTKSKGNMYEWVTHTHSHLAGECSHKCSYCYVQKMTFNSAKYKGELRLVESELDVNYGDGKVIFIEHMNDLFAEAVPDNYIVQILDHCRLYPQNTYVFQTKNPEKLWVWSAYLPPKIIVGTTIETNYINKYSKAPSPYKRFCGMLNMKESDLIYKLFVTIEPIMRFDLAKMVSWLSFLKPDFINIGADSKNCNLPEPTRNEVNALISALQGKHLNVKIKDNLSRLLE